PNGVPVLTRQLRIAVTADLHWGHRHGQDAARALADFLHREPPDVLLIAGDVGTGILYEDCLRLFADLPCVKAVVPGNHDLWVGTDVRAPASLALYQRWLPGAWAGRGFASLDAGPVELPEHGLTLVGTINWYDSSWAIDGIRRDFPAEEHR